MTIQFECTQVTLSVNATLALLEFASKDATRPHLCGVGISEGKLAATDGHTLLRFETVRDDSSEECVVKNEGLHSRMWSRKYVAEQVAIAKARKTDVALEYGMFDDGLSSPSRSNWTFPPVAQVIPEPGLTYGRNKKKVERSKAQPIGLDATYLARLAKVCKACETKGAALSSASGELDPVAFKVMGLNGLNATVVIMPMRL